MFRAFLIAQLVKNLPAIQEAPVWFLGWEDPLEKAMATHSSILAWRTPRTVYSMGSQRVRLNWVTFTFTYLALMSLSFLHVVACVGMFFLLKLNLSLSLSKLLQSCPTLCDPIDSSPPGSAIPGILQARTLEWAAISFSNAWKWKVKGKSLSRVWLLATPWTAAYQAPPSMGFSRPRVLEWGAIAFSVKLNNTP